MNISDCLFYTFCNKIQLHVSHMVMAWPDKTRRYRQSYAQRAFGVGKMQYLCKVVQWVMIPDVTQICNREINSTIVIMRFSKAWLPNSVASIRYIVWAAHQLLWLLSTLIFSAATKLSLCHSWLCSCHSSLGSKGSISGQRELWMAPPVLSDSDYLKPKMQDKLKTVNVVHILRIYYSVK